MAYADFTFYTEGYLGTAVTATDFPRLAQRASYLIDQITFGKAKIVVDTALDSETIEKIKLATCSVSEELLKIEQGGEITSERVGNYSVSYAPTNQSEMGRIIGAVKPYLFDTELLYRGVDAY